MHNNSKINAYRMFLQFKSRKSFDFLLFLNYFFILIFLFLDIYSFFKNCSHFEILFSNPSEIIYLTWNIRYFGACNGVIACSVFADMWYEY